MLALSVVIPTYQRKECLENLIGCLLDQTIWDQMEVVVVDQNERGFLKDVITNDILKQVRLVRGEQPNVSLARNIGFQMSRADTILFIDDDLEPSPDFCQNGLDNMENYQLSCLAPLIYNDKGKSFEKRIQLRRATGKAHGHLIRVRESTSAAFFIRREIYRRIGGFDPVLFDFAGATEDREFFLRMNKKGVDLWMDLELPIYHSEEVRGGCKLRDQDYWTNRRNFMKGWIYGAQKRSEGKINIMESWNVWRSSFFNKKVILEGPGSLWNHIKCYRQAKREVYREFPGICDEPSRFIT